jgi:hypothetical protein
LRFGIPVSGELCDGVAGHQRWGDKGYRGHNHAQKFRVWISGQVRRVTAPIRRESAKPKFLLWLDETEEMTVGRSLLLAAAWPDR